ncbi:hypothetical protein D9599_25610 [Roseomonas sp. KE2513]|uniref:hypothetical protein n=1 Tax=Roseomonas sp. KE2513 TaxID=2479202 RepID=UPI0018DF01A3|nr:hypothetical protein [Roseomonas sp. KE2513]MBI0538934.1 hypothetical protein [Roseomonas sp. KE2513]
MATPCAALHRAFQLALMDVIDPGMDWEEAVKALLEARDRLAGPLALSAETCAVGSGEQQGLSSALQAGFQGAMSALPVPVDARNEPHEWPLLQA